MALLFDIPYFDKLPESYQTAVKKLDSDLKESPNKFIDVLSKFVKTYTTITPIWDYWKSNINGHIDWYSKLGEQQLCHFYSFSYLRKHMNQTLSNNKVCNDVYSTILKARITRRFRNSDEYKEYIQYSEEALKYPSECLKEIFLVYRITLGSFLSDKIRLRYQRSLELLNELKAAQFNDKKWIECLMKVENEDFIIKNFEFRLEEFPWCMQLWQFYINYLRKINSKFILKVFSRYCRFFDDDFIVAENYRNEIERVEKEGKIDVAKWWIDIILFETNNVNGNACKTLSRALSTPYPKSKCLIKFAQKFVRKLDPIYAKEINKLIEMAKTNIGEFDSAQNILLSPIFDNEILWFTSYGVYFLAKKSNKSTVPLITVGNFDTYLPQQFSLPKTICNYIFHDPSYLLRQKLFFSCKYFVIRYQTPICCNIVIKMSPIPEYYEQSVKVPETSLEAVKDFYVVNSLDAWSTESHLTLSNLCSIVYQFDLKFMRLHSQTLSWKEFKFLTEPGNLDSVYLVFIRILHSNGIHAKIEEVIERFPSASRMLIYIPSNRSSETAQNLLKQKRKRNIERLSFSAYHLEAKSFCQFIKKNAAPNAQIDARFELNMEQHDYELLKEGIANLVQTWVPQSERPAIGLQEF